MKSTLVTGKILVLAIPGILALTGNGGGGRIRRCKPYPGQRSG